jgi:hypothetical protein
MLRRTFSLPLALLLMVTALFTFLLQSGELGTSDTTHRLQVAHALWTGEPQVFPQEFPEFGVHGRGGRLYASYGIGQSLLLLPFDVAGTAASRLPLWRSYVAAQEDPAIRSIVVSIGVNLLVNVLSALAAFRLLRLLGFTVRESVIGTLSLLYATTHLHYAQNMTENNYILLLTLTGFGLQYRWLVSGERRWLFWGSAALGLNLLTRITTVLDVAACAVFLLLSLWFGRGTDRLNVTPTAFLKTALPIYAFFLLADRVYQYIRFDSWTTSYVGLMAREQRALNPLLPANFPFDGHWFQGGIGSGVLGPFFAPEKSVFLFDPMFPLALLVMVLLWRRMTPAVRAFSGATLLLLLGTTAFYAGYDSWGGDYAWGDRYLSSAVELVTLPVLPLLLRHRRALPGYVWVGALCVTGISVVVQVASTAFWLPLELYQGETFGRHIWTVGLRMKNIAGFALGRSAAWGLNTPAIFEDPWDARHLTTWNYLPSLLRHSGVAPLYAVRMLDAAWVMVAIALVALAARLLRMLVPRTNP